MIHDVVWDRWQFLVIAFQYYVSLKAQGPLLCELNAWTQTKYRNNCDNVVCDFGPEIGYTWVIEMNLDNAFSIYIFKCAFASNRISREWGRVGFSCQRGGDDRRIF